MVEQLSTIEAINQPESHPLHGKKIAVIGGGPAGSFFSIVLLNEAQKIGLKLHLEIFETRAPRLSEGESPRLCTGCAGLIQGDVISLMGKNGLEIPETVRQSSINQSIIHFPGEKDTISLPTKAQTVYRGFSPIKPEGNQLIGSFDAFLLDQAIQAGAVHHQTTINQIDITDPNNPQIFDSQGNIYHPDLIIGAFGHNRNLIKNIKLPPDYNNNDFLPKVGRAGVREYFLRDSKLLEGMGDQLHIFGNPTDNIWFAAVIPKKEYVTIVLMARRDIQPNEDFAAFLTNSQVQKLLGQAIDPQIINCSCRPLITLRSPTLFMIPDSSGNMVMINIGDAGPTRPRKNGLSAAMYSAEQLSQTLIEDGVSPRSFRKVEHYLRKNYVTDNRYVEAVLKMADIFLNHKLPRQAALYLVNKDIPLVSDLINSSLNLVVTGRQPYWRLPISAIEETFFHKIE